MVDENEQVHERRLGGLGRWRPYQEEINRVLLRDQPRMVEPRFMLPPNVVIENVDVDAGTVSFRTTPGSNPVEVAERRVGDLERQQRRMRGRYNGPSRRAIDRDLHFARQDLEQARRRADEEARRGAGRGSHEFNPIPWDLDSLLYRERASASRGLSWPITYPEPPPENLTDHERRKREIMNTEGNRVHLTTRDGYKKTIRIPGTIGTTVVLPEQLEASVAAVTSAGDLRQAATPGTIRRRTFRVTRKALYTDLSNGGAQTEEFWALEQ